MNGFAGGPQDWLNRSSQLISFFLPHIFLFNYEQTENSYTEEKDEIYPERVMESSLELNNGTALWLPFRQLSESGLSSNEVE